MDWWHANGVVRIFSLRQIIGGPVFRGLWCGIQVSIKQMNKQMSVDRRLKRAFCWESIE
jgi:hypothetical protein